jgi:hypothetical protein
MTIPFELKQTTFLRLPNRRNYSLSEAVEGNMFKRAQLFVPIPSNVLFATALTSSETDGRYHLAAPTFSESTLQIRSEHKGEPLNKPNASIYAWASGVAIVGLSLHFYYVRELVVSMALFSVAFFSLTLAVLGAFLISYAGKQVAVWARPASRSANSLPRDLAPNGRP